MSTRQHGYKFQTPWVDEEKSNQVITSITGQMGKCHYILLRHSRKCSLGEAPRWVDAKLLNVPTNDSLSY